MTEDELKVAADRLAYRYGLDASFVLTYCRRELGLAVTSRDIDAINRSYGGEELSVARFLSFRKAVGKAIGAPAPEIRTEPYTPEEARRHRDAMDAHVDRSARSSRG